MSYFNKGIILEELFDLRMKEPIENPKSYLPGGQTTKDTDGCMVDEILSSTYEVDRQPKTLTSAWSMKS